MRDLAIILQLLDRNISKFVTNKQLKIRLGLSFPNTMLNSSTMKRNNLKIQSQVRHFLHKIFPPVLVSQCCIRNLYKLSCLKQWKHILSQSIEARSLQSSCQGHTRSYGSRGESLTLPVYGGYRHSWLGTAWLQSLLPSAQGLLSSVSEIPVSVCRPLTRTLVI